MKTVGTLIIAILCLCLPAYVSAQVPGIINYQGRVSVSGTNFDGTGQFQFALVNNGATTYWSNGVNTVSVPVTKGLYSVLLGDTGIANMDAAIPTTVFTNADVRLRVWFDGGAGMQQLSPDQRLAAVGYALMAGNVPDGAITSNKLAAGAVTSAQLASNLTISGTLTAGSFQGNGAMPWQVSTGTTQLASANTGYLLTNAATTTVTLPATANVGDVVRISGTGAGGWVAQAALSSWTARESNRNWSVVASSADGAKLVAADSTGRIYTSTDSGTSWTPRESNRVWHNLGSSADGTKLAAAVYQDTSIYTSTNSGFSWVPHGTSSPPGYWNSMASSADGTRLMAVAWSDYIYISTNSGVTWTARETPRNWLGGASSADGMKLVALVYNGQIYTSTNSGVTWTAREIGRLWRGIASSADGTKLVATVDNGQIYTSTDSGVNWTPRETNRAWNAVASSDDGVNLVAPAARSTH
jgi:photosystem II stability/assembly factor-like uncharacterized protein